MLRYRQTVGNSVIGRASHDWRSNLLVCKMRPAGKVVLAFLISVNLMAVNCDDSECKGNSESPYYKLHTCIKTSYDATVRPVKDPKAAVEVNASFTVRYIDMDEKYNILTVHVYMELMWMDEFVKWDPLDYGGIRNTVLTLGDVWTPDLQVYNDRIYWGGRSDLYVYDIHAYYTGLMYAVAQGEMVAHCNLDIYKWPFDRHSCMANVGSTNYFGNQLRINFGKYKVKTNMYLNSSVWELEDIKAKRTNITQTFGNNSKYEYLRFDKTFIVRRYSSAMFATVAVPVIACVFLTLGSLWIDPQEMTRIISILTAIIVQTSLLQYLGENLPSNAKKGVLVIALLRDSLVLNFLAFLVTVANRHLQTFKTTPPHSVMSLIGKLTATGPSKFLLLPEESATNASDDEVSLVKSTNKFKHEWVLISSLIDRLTFIIFIFVYMVLLILYTTL